MWLQFGSAILEPKGHSQTTPQKFAKDPGKIEYPARNDLNAPHLKYGTDPKNNLARVCDQITVFCKLHTIYNVQ
jgi:hypothetical protein